MLPTIILQFFYEKGLVGNPDSALAIKYYKLAVAAGSPESMYYLGAKYLSGNGVPKNTKKTLNCIKKRLIKTM